MSNSAIYALFLCTYFAFMIIVGIYHYRKTTSVDEYLVSSWNVGFWQIVGTTIATWCGASAFIGFMGMGFTTGISGIFFWVIPGVALTIIFILLFARILRRLKLYTIPDVFALRYGKNAAFIPSLFQIFVYSIPTLALQFIGLGTIFNGFFGINLQIGIVIGFALIFTYTYMGGMPSVILTDSIQTVILYIGIILLFILGIQYAGGTEKIVANTPADLFHPFGKQGFGTFLSLALTVGPFYMMWQCTWQRIYAAKDEKTAVNGLTVGFILAGLATVLSFSIGIIARGYLPLDTKPDMVFSTSLATVFPVLVGAICVTGLAAALMSSADSFIMMGSASIARDIYQQYFRPNATTTEMLNVSRYSVIGISISALIIAVFAKGIIPVYILVVKTCGAGLVFPFFALMFWKRSTRKGVLASMVSGALVTVGWNMAGNPLGIIDGVAGYVASLFFLIVVSLATKHSPDEQVVAAYFYQLDTTKYNERMKNRSVLDDVGAIGNGAAA